ncbi:hypothetical protein KAOT1_05412 [Kordia algicida OT-1]|uniref:Uncharacterized protein n=1 Tax=Kordia algicida OT-1 TaxID=391587 RepID=A9E099_9FLAO|nr:hypothetical protein KAOT1_05412 [Kordia algicida OT-1]
MRICINQDKNLRIIRLIKMFKKACVTIGIEMNEIIRRLDGVHNLKKTINSNKIKPFLNKKIIIQ